MRHHIRSGITTRYRGPTNTLGSRIIVTDNHSDARRITVSWDHALNTAENHAHAAQAWLEKFIPYAQVVSPGIDFGAGYAWTWEDQR
tara:strand:+ start:1859 stop:2119 length:261 start_codon:yes stop_codon:yes gene_type:complete